MYWVFQEAANHPWAQGKDSVEGASTLHNLGCMMHLGGCFSHLVATLAIIMLGCEILNLTHLCADMALTVFEMLKLGK